MIAQPPNYAAAWDELRKRQRLFFLAWLGGFAVVVLLSTVKIPQWVPLTVWLAAFLWTGSRWSLFLCPRCQKHFFKPKSWLIDQTLQNCPHCGLPKYGEGDGETETGL